MPPVLRFEDASAPFPHRLQTLTTWLETRSEEELKKKLTCAYAAQLVKSIGRMSAAQRLQVAEKLWTRVSDPHRLFIMLETIPRSRVHELVEKINEAQKEGEREEDG